MFETILSKIYLLAEEFQAVVISIQGCCLNRLPFSKYQRSSGFKAEFSKKNY